jgi:multidrug efflux pump
MEKKRREFFATSWAIDNKISIYVLIFMISLFGMLNYYTMPEGAVP